MTAQQKEGRSVAIRRDDGSEFLCHSGLGHEPPVWRVSHRKGAVAHKRELIEHGFRARVVRVRHSPAVVVEK